MLTFVFTYGKPSINQSPNAIRENLTYTFRIYTIAFKPNTMRKYILTAAGIVLITLSLFIISWKPSVVNTKSASLSTKVPVAAVSEDSLYSAYVTDLYTAANLAQTGLNRLVFEKALTGFYNLKNSGKLSASKSILSIADMDQSSSTKRLWVIDLDKKELLINTWVAHGKNTGDDRATHFSNINSSNQSSIGFYVTAEVYNGKHGRSLKLDGMDAGYNSNARQRAIVVHGADYVSQGTINALGRLGRSQGCPAVAPEYADKVINAIEGKTVLFINGNDQNYTSRYLDQHIAASFAGINAQQTLPANASLLPAKSLKVGI